MLRVRDDIFNRALYVRNQCIDILQAAAETSVSTEEWILLGRGCLLIPAVLT